MPKHAPLRYCSPSCNFYERVFKLSRSCSIKKTETYNIKCLVKLKKTAKSSVLDPTPVRRRVKTPYLQLVFEWHKRLWEVRWFVDDVRSGRPVKIKKSNENVNKGKDLCHNRSAFSACHVNTADSSDEARCISRCLPPANTHTAWIQTFL